MSNIVIQNVWRHLQYKPSPVPKFLTFTYPSSVKHFDNFVPMKKKLNFCALCEPEQRLLVLVILVTPQFWTLLIIVKAFCPHFVRTGKQTLTYWRLRASLGAHL